MVNFYDVLSDDWFSAETKKLALTHDIDDITNVYVDVETRALDGKMIFTIMRRHANGYIEQFGNYIILDLDGRTRKKEVAFISEEIKEAAKRYTPAICY